MHFYTISFDLSTPFGQKPSAFDTAIFSDITGQFDQCDKARSFAKAVSEQLKSKPNAKRVFHVFRHTKYPPELVLSFEDGVEVYSIFKTSSRK